MNFSDNSEYRNIDANGNVSAKVQKVINSIPEYKQGTVVIRFIENLNPQIRLFSFYYKITSRYFKAALINANFSLLK